MRPNTPHAILTPTSTICHGSHYLSTSTIRSSCYGYYITFCLSTLLTNTEHTSDCQRLFRRLVDFFHSSYLRGKSHSTGPLAAPIAHVPDISSFDGLHDLFTICNLIELSNAVHPLSYSSHGLDPAERYDMIQARRKSREVVTWVLSNYEFEGDATIELFYWHYLAHQAQAICCSKEFAEEREAYSYNSGPFGDKVRRLIKHSFANVEEFWPMWEVCNCAEPCGFAWPSSMACMVQLRAAQKDGMPPIFLTSCACSCSSVKLSWSVDGTTYDDLFRMDMAPGRGDDGAQGTRKKRKMPM